MAATGWTWAELNSDKLALVAQAEQAFGADYLLVYQPADQPEEAVAETQMHDLHAAPLTDSELECLQGLESQLQAVVVAYKHLP